MLAIFLLYVVLWAFLIWRAQSKLHRKSYQKYAAIAQSRLQLNHM